MLVFSGDAPDNPSDIRDAKGVTVFHCKGASKSEARAVQVGWPTGEVRVLEATALMGQRVIQRPTGRDKLRMAGPPCQAFPCCF